MLEREEGLLAGGRDRVDWHRLLEDAGHRPWPLPRRAWRMTMSWHDLLFAHWPVPADVLRPLVPGGLSLDTFDGSGWLGVVPFRMTHVGHRGVPELPWISSFCELNVRTYVGLEGRPGVWFFSLDAANPLAVAAARAAFHLPYFRARMSLDRAEDGRVRYRSRRTHRGAPPAEFRGSYAPEGAPFQAVPGSLDHWLTERYCLYAGDRRGRLYRGDIHHPPWTLHRAGAEIEVETTAAAAGIRLPDRPPLLHFAGRQDVVGWYPERVGGPMRRG